MEVKTVAPQFRGIPKLSGDTPDMIGRCKLERRIVWNLIKHLNANGFVCHSVYDGEEYLKTRTPIEMMEAAFAVDESTIRFCRPDDPSELKGRLLGVFLVGGNGVDIVSDYSAPSNDPFNWNGVMDAFDAYTYE